MHSIPPTPFLEVGLIYSHQKWILPPSASPLNPHSGGLDLAKQRKSLVKITRLSSKLESKTLADVFLQHTVPVWVAQFA
jgi:hypothetical protein